MTVNSKQKKQVVLLIETAKSAIQEVMMYRDCTFEEAIEHLEELQSDCEGFIDGFRDDIKNRDSE